MPSLHRGRGQVHRAVPRIQPRDPGHGGGDKGAYGEVGSDEGREVPDPRSVPQGQIQKRIRIRDILWGGESEIRGDSGRAHDGHEKDAQGPRKLYERFR